MVTWLFSTKEYCSSNFTTLINAKKACLLKVKPNFNLLKLKFGLKIDNRGNFKSQF